MFVTKRPQPESQRNRILPMRWAVVGLVIGICFALSGNTVFAVLAGLGLLAGVWLWRREGNLDGIWAAISSSSLGIGIFVAIDTLTTGCVGADARNIMVKDEYGNSKFVSCTEIVSNHWAMVTVLLSIGIVAAFWPWARNRAQRLEREKAAQ